MKIIVIDNNTQEVIIYSFDIEDLILGENIDESEAIEELISRFHHLSEVSWMVLKENFIIEYKEL
jgi:hypothetical protein